MESLINDSVLRITIAYKNITFKSLKCELQRGAGQSSSQTTHKTEGGLTVRAKNNSNQKVHFYPEGQSPSPSNRVTACEAKTITISVPLEGFLRFYAGTELFVSADALTMPPYSDTINKNP